MCIGCRCCVDGGKEAKMWQIKMRLGRGQCMCTLRRTTFLSCSPSVSSEWGSQFLGVPNVCLLPLKSSQGFSGKFSQSQGVGYIDP